MSQTGAGGFRRSDRGDSSLPPPIVVFDPAGDISVADTRSLAGGRAATFAAVADDFAARFGLDGADDWADEIAAQLEAGDADDDADDGPPNDADGGADDVDGADDGMQPVERADAAADVATGRRAAETSARSASEARWIGAAGSVGAPTRPRRVTITGRGAEGYATPRQLSSRRELAARRPMPTLSERMGFRADRVALWAVALGLLLVLVAAMSAHAAVLH